MMKNENLAVDVVTNELVDSSVSSLLSAEEEVVLAQKIAKGGDEGREARNQLVMANMKLVTYFAKRFIGCGAELEELISMGTEGLIHAAEKFDPSRGARFSTCAAFWIRQAISRGIANESCVVRVPVHVKTAMFQIKRAQRELSVELGVEPNVEEIAAYTGLSVEKVRDTMEHTYNIVSMDATVDEDGKTTIEDFCADENADDPCDVAVWGDLQEAIQFAMDKLEPKEAMVIKLRYGFVGDHPMTLDEIASLPIFNVTRERIRQIEKRALNKIRRSYSAMECLREYAC